MKTLRLILLGVVLIDLLSILPAHAQIYYRRGVRGMVPNQRAYPNPYQYPLGQTNAPTPVQPAAPAIAPPPGAQSATNSIATNHVLYRIVQPPVDPEKVKAARAESQRKALEFQKKRADEGSESAQYELGVRYLRGDLVEKDEATARKWLTLSAKNGYSPAEKKLEELDKMAKAKDEKETK